MTLWVCTDKLMYIDFEAAVVNCSIDYFMNWPMKAIFLQSWLDCFGPWRWVAYPVCMGSSRIPVSVVKIFFWFTIIWQVQCKSVWNLSENMFSLYVFDDYPWYFHSIRCISLQNYPCYFLFVTKTLIVDDFKWDFHRCNQNQVIVMSNN